jgi:FtsP/CotA-like multicopper oxidase with cupredoxin domain
MVITGCRGRAAAAIALISGLLAASLLTNATAGPVRQRAYSIPLPFPKVLRLGAKTKTLTAKAAGVPILPGAKTPMWTFGGTFPGPTLSLKSGTTGRLRVVNHLPTAAGDISVHLHGNHQPSRDDGQPDRFLIGTGDSFTYRYPTVFDGKPERGQFSWYHDHTMGVTGRNIWRGLAGMAIIRDPREKKFDLPTGRYDVPLMLALRSFDENNKAAYPDGANNMPPSDVVGGDTVVTNGVVHPYLDVAARRYRLRILNASNFLPLNLHLSNDQPLVQIGTGEDLLPAPVERDTLLIGPAQRADVIVDFSDALDEKVILESLPRPSQVPPVTGSPALPIMRFNVTHRAPDTSRIPAKLLDPPAWVADAPSMPDRAWAFGLGMDGQGSPAWTINGQAYDMQRVDAEVPRDSVETWQFSNTSTVSHFVHVHSFYFVVLSRNGADPPAWETGLQDTVLLDPGETVDVALKFPDYLGRFIIHCHMLEHEDHGMMAAFKVVK